MNFEDMAFLFRCDERNRGIIRLNFDEAALVWKCVKETRGDILEIGRCNGGSTLLMTSAADASREITSIDLHTRLDPVALAMLVRSTNVELLEQAAKEVVSNPLGFGFLLIGGDHTYEGFRRDVVAYWDDVDAGGLVAFHGPFDDGEDSHCLGVSRVVFDLVFNKYGKEKYRAGSLLVLEKVMDLDIAF